VSDLRKSLIADGALLLVAISWGLNFVVEKNVLLVITPYMYLGLRFVLSALLMAVIFHKKLKQICKEDIKAGLVVGLFMLLGFLTQTVGLVYTTPSKSGFITGSNVVMVPFLAYLLTKKFPGMFQIMGAIVTFGGLALISVNDNLAIGQGDILTFLCAICFALQITFTEYYVKKADPLNMAFIQVALAGIITMGMTVIQEPVSLGFDLKIWGAIIFGVVFCTAGAFAVQNIAQKYTSSTHAAVIMCTEAVFAGIFSFLLWDEPLTLKTLSGFVLVLAGVLITELVPSETIERVKEYVDTAI
jgi:drug/metabolite transporter (DMT)-like permease